MVIINIKSDSHFQIATKHNNSIDALERCLFAWIKGPPKYSAQS